MPDTWFDELTQSPIGALTVQVTRLGVRRVLFGKAQALAESQAEGYPPACLYQALRQLREYLQGARRVFDLPLDLSGTSVFQNRVLQACRQIPYGQVRTYGDLAKEVGAGSSASRAVGMIMAGNPLPLLIPCHRVLGKDGALRGYAAPGGVETKAWLLRLEGARLLG